MRVLQSDLAGMLTMLSSGLTHETVARRQCIHLNTLKYRLLVCCRWLKLPESSTPAELICAAIQQGWIPDRRQAGRAELEVFVAYLKAGLPAAIGAGIGAYLEARFKSWRPEQADTKDAAA